MPGPPPKINRQRRQTPTRGDWQVLAPLTAPLLPPLDELDGGPWTQRAQMFWSAWRDDPVTATWNKTDVGFAIDTLHLLEAAPVSMASEIRLRLESLALTPKGRQMARLLLPDEARADDATESTRPTRLLPAAV